MSEHHLPKFIYLLTLLTLLALLTPFAFPVQAKDPIILEYPSEITESASASAHIRFEMGGSIKPGTEYFIKPAFYATPSGTYKNYFGKTWVGSGWVENVGSYLNQLPVILGDDKAWGGWVGFMVDREDSGYGGPWIYNLVLGRYTAKGGGPTWSEPVLITVLDSGEPDFSVDDITHIRQLPKGTEIQTHGLVTVEQGPLGDDVFYLEDDFAGIKVDLPKDYKSGVRLGDKARVGCTVEESRGEKYIKVEEGDSVAVLETNLACRAPNHIATGTVLDNWEGRLVEVEGEVVETSGDTFYLDDGSGKIKVYIRESTGIDKPPMSRGDTTRARGIISQWGQHNDGSDNYRLMPRYPEDLVVFPKVEEAATADDTNSASPSAQVLGATDILPETGPALLTKLTQVLARLKLHLMVGLP